MVLYWSGCQFPICRIYTKKTKKFSNKYYCQTETALILKQYLIGFQIALIFSYSITKKGVASGMKIRYKKLMGKTHAT